MSKIKILSGLIITFLLLGGGLLIQKYSSSRHQINLLNLDIENLENELNNAKNKITELEKENLELSDKLSSVRHFDSFEFAEKGFSGSSSINFTGQVLETQIDGDFEGWEGETIFKMIDGTIWQQMSYDYTYHYSFMPDVIIYKKNGAFYMRVEDVEDEIQVIQIK